MIRLQMPGQALACGRFMCAFEPFGQHLQCDVANSKRLEFFHRCQHVIAAWARAAVTLPRVVQLLGQTELTGVLAVTAVHNIAKRVHTFLRVVVKPDPSPGLAVNPGDLLAGSQVFDRFQAPVGGHAIGHASTIAPTIEAEYQPGLLGRSSMHERINAKCAMGPHQTRVPPLQKGEAGPPHQRPVGEDPEVLVVLPGVCGHRGGGVQNHGVSEAGDPCPRNKAWVSAQLGRGPRAQKRRIRRVFEFR
jgi:hypothetical protein